MTYKIVVLHTEYCYAKCHNAESHSSLCHYAESRGTVKQALFFVLNTSQRHNFLTDGLVNCKTWLFFGIGSMAMGINLFLGHMKEFSPSNVTVYLVGGVSNTSGNVYTFNPDTGVTGPICDSNWGLFEALVLLLKNVFLLKLCSEQRVIKLFMTINYLCL